MSAAPIEVPPVVPGDLVLVTARSWMKDKMFWVVLMVGLVGAVSNELDGKPITKASVASAVIGVIAAVWRTASPVVVSFFPSLNAPAKG